MKPTAVLLRVAAAFLSMAAVSTMARSDAPPASMVPAAGLGTTVLTVNLQNVARGILGVHLVIPVSPGPLTLAYPKWVPGHHAPTGPITHLAGLTLTANGERITWTRDPVKMYEFHVTIPAGAQTLDVRMDMLGMQAAAHKFDRNLADMAWNTVLLYPLGKPVWDERYQANLVLPAGWKYATALTTTARDGDTVHFAPTSLYTLIDSPVLAGAFYREVPLTTSPRVTLDLFADDRELLTTLHAPTIDAYRRLLTQEYAMFGGYHYEHYDFLVSLSDYVRGGLEHHQSSEDDAGADYFADPDGLLAEADLIPHEFTHSWNGKYVRPAGLATSDYQQPMEGNLLWVYEGLTQYIGEVMAARAGLWTPLAYRDQLAYWAAYMAHRTGRSWRSFEDTAVAAPLRFVTNSDWANYKRMNGIDLYFGGVLLWLDVDTRIRQLSHGQRSLNDFCKLFFGHGGHSTATVTYTFQDVVAALDKVQPYNWASFIHNVIDRAGPDVDAPLAGITQGGWRLVYDDTESAFMQAMSHGNLFGTPVQTLNEMFSIGVEVDGKGKVGDVLWNGPAFEAGLTPGMTIVAIDGVAFTAKALTAAIAAAKDSPAPIRMLVRNDAWYENIEIPYHGGLRYPHLVRAEGTPDYLDGIIAPLPVAKPELQGYPAHRH